MLNHISWYSFILFMASLVSAYYLYVIARFYRKDILLIMSGKRRFQNENPVTTKDSVYERKQSISKEPVREKDDSSSFTLVHELLEELKDIFQRASQSRIIKEELIQALGSKLKTYPSLRETDLVEDINNHLIMEAMEKCDLEFLPEDLKRIWNT